MQELRKSGAQRIGLRDITSMKRSGVADSPSWWLRPTLLAERMTKLGTAITETIVHDYGTSVFLSRLSDPFWFQALGAVMGMDCILPYHTSVMGALKRGLSSRADELGIYICGARDASQHT